MKLCRHCGVEKPFEDFYKDKNKPHGLHSWCKVCASEQGKRWSRENAERVKQINAEWRAKNQSQIKARNREKYYGTNGADLFIEQGGRCGVCGTDLTQMPEKHRHLDHDHDSGLVRGWLCHWCNLGIGKFKDNPELLRAAADYLEVRRMI